ncbi:MAG: glycoside hydrolase family 57 protein [Spirochaetaceae bacterium]
MKGNIGFVLHAHLPFVRHPEYECFLEEDWLYEAISETYLPFLRMCNRLVEEKVGFRFTLSISPTLSAMLSDQLLQKRYIRHLKKLIDLGEKEIERTKNKPELQHLARMYKSLFEQNLYDFTEVYRKKILWGFKALEKEGHLEIITTSATHAFLPLYQQHPESVEAQVQTAVIDHCRNFGKKPAGFWLPEFGFYPGIEKVLKHNNIDYFFTSAHGILFAEKKPPYGVYAPLECEGGIHAFGRDYPTSDSVWSEDRGYPSDVDYREFYRDIGYDLPLSYIQPYIHEPEVRVCTGYKYYSITGETEEKKLYNRERALKKVEEHADNFIYNRRMQLQKFEGIIDRTPYIIAPFDAELFGHWWFEGISWLEAVVRRIDVSEDLDLITPSEYLKQYPSAQKGTPSFSSWGNKGYAEVWLSGKNDWIYRHIHKAIERMVELVDRYPDETGLKLRVLDQAAREVMLAMASDWPFIMNTGTTVPYAERRIKEHLYNFNYIYERLCRNTVDTEWLTTIEKKQNLFSDIDYRVFKRTGSLSADGN